MRSLTVTVLTAVVLSAGPPELAQAPPLPARPELPQVPSLATVDGFVGRVHTTPTGAMPYRLFVPQRYDPARKYPLVMWLHGGGGVGTDNLSQIAGDQMQGTRFWTTPAAQAKYPSFVLAPQAGELQRGSPVWLRTNGAQALDVLETVGKEFSLDASRIYVVGQSMGGLGAVSLLFQRPRLFAAAVVLCAQDLRNVGVDDATRAATIAHVPIWGFQGDQDLPHFINGMRTMIAALKNAGGHPRYTEYPGVGHDVWTRAFKEPELLDWVFSNRLPTK